MLQTKAFLEISAQFQTLSDFAFSLHDNLLTDGYPVNDDSTSPAILATILAIDAALKLRMCKHDIPELYLYGLGRDRTFLDKQVSKTNAKFMAAYEDCKAFSETESQTGLVQSNDYLFEKKMLADKACGMAERILRLFIFRENMLKQYQFLNLVL